MTKNKYVNIDYGFLDPSKAITRLEELTKQLYFGAMEDVRSLLFKHAKGIRDARKNVRVCVDKSRNEEISLEDELTCSFSIKADWPINGWATVYPAERRYIRGNIRPPKHGNLRPGKREKLLYKAVDTTMKALGYKIKYRGN